MALHRLGQPGLGNSGGGGAVIDPAVGWNPVQEEFIDTAHLGLSLGVVSTSGSFNQAGSDLNHPGVGECFCNTGTFTVQTQQAAIFLGGGIWTFSGDVLIPVLSAPANRFTVYTVGLVDGVATGITNNEVDFRYSDNVNGGRWQCVTRSGGTDNANLDSGITVTALTWYKLVATVNANASSVEFRINGALVVTSTTHIPLNGLNLLAVKTENGTGTGGSARIDFLKPTFVATTPR
jgi:hypothetical protein